MVQIKELGFFMSTRFSSFNRRTFDRRSIPTLTDGSFSQSRVSKFWTKEQCSHGGIKSSANKRDRVLVVIDALLEPFALDCEERGVRFSMAAFFRLAFPGRNVEALRRGYQAYIKGRLGYGFISKCASVRRFILFCASIRAALSRRPLSSIVRQWSRIGRALSSNPFRVSLAKSGAVWNESLRIWELVDLSSVGAFPAFRV